MRFASLFSGAGLFDYGLELSGWVVTQQCEVDAYALRVLRQHWPDVPKWGDVRTLQMRRGQVEAIVGGFPCNDLSNALTNGARRGLDGEKSGLWTEQRRLIDEGRPRIVVVENAGAWRRWVPSVRGDLWALGYASVPLRLRASDFGAPHARDRVFVVAHADGNGEPLRALHAKVAGLRPVSGAVRHGRPSPPGGFRVDDGTPQGMDRCRVVGEGVDVRVASWLGAAIKRVLQ